MIYFFSEVHSLLYRQNLIKMGTVSQPSLSTTHSSNFVCYLIVFGGVSINTPFIICINRMRLKNKKLSSQGKPVFLIHKQEIKQWLQYPG